MPRDFAIPQEPKWAKMVEKGKETRFKKGHTPWHKGSRGKFANALKGKKMPAWWRAKLSAAKKGKAAPHLHTPEVRAKRGLSQRGPKHHNWQGGGLRSVHDRVRTSVEYKKWRKDVYERDGYACVVCGDNRGGNLQADHFPTALALILREIELHYGKEAIYEVALTYPRLWDISNGRTLCTKCHYATETYGGRLSHKLKKQYAK